MATINVSVNINNKIQARLMIQRKPLRHIMILGLTLSLSYYIFVLLITDFKSPRVMSLTEIDRCPACYGVSVCPEIFSSQIYLDSNFPWLDMFNAKNVYQAYTRTLRPVVLKKLAHDSELKEFDSKLCEAWTMDTCTPMGLVNVSKIDEKILRIVDYDTTAPDTAPRKGLVVCPNPQSFFDLIQPLVNERNENYNSEMMNMWTMVSINPEPILLQVLPKAVGWRVPSYGGVCGRLEVVSYDGEPLSALGHRDWHRKLKHAKEILEAAIEFTFLHERFRFYLLDWSLDNIVANDEDRVSFVDLEDVVVLDKHLPPSTDIHGWYLPDIHDIEGPGFAFSIRNMCKHYLSDHNIWAACYILANEEDGYLHPIPKDVIESHPDLENWLNDCLHGENRYKAVEKLNAVIKDILK